MTTLKGLWPTATAVRNPLGIRRLLQILNPYRCLCASLTLKQFFTSPVRFVFPLDEVANYESDSETSHPHDSGRIDVYCLQEEPYRQRAVTRIERIRPQ